MVDRIIGVLKMDVNTFEEIEADETATTQAAMIVAAVAVISGLGGGIWALVAGGGFFGSLISGILTTLIGWVAWSAITFFVGTNLFEGKADLGQMLRVIGFAFVPQVISFIPCVGFLAAIYSLVLGFIAVRQGLDLDNTKAALTVGVGMIVYLLISFAIGAIFGIAAFGANLITG